MVLKILNWFSQLSRHRFVDANYNYFLFTSSHKPATFILNFKQDFHFENKSRQGEITGSV